MEERRGKITWLHLSDFHIGKDDYAARKMFDYIFSHVKQQRDIGIIPDYIFVTGDIANSGESAQYDTFWLEFILPLQELVGGNVAERTFVVPGNHDVQRARNPAFSQSEISEPNSRYLDPTEEGKRLRDEMLVPRFRNFIDYDCTRVKGFFQGVDGAFVHAETFNEINVGLAGINTAWLSKGDSDERKLTPGKALLEQALERIKGCDLRIVLGHHPIDWFVPAHQKPLKSLLGQSSALYLHGHLHDAWAEPTYGGGGQFLAIQAGAGFQAREGERWRNGVIWGEALPSEGMVKFQAWRWVAEQQAWVPATEALHEHHRRGDWWHYDLPRISASPVNKSPLGGLQLPRGFSLIEPKHLTAHLRPLDVDVARRYFDGSAPDWSTALSTSIPRRRIVDTLSQHFQSSGASRKSIVTLLVSAACEGKTTALLQAAYNVVSGQETKWRILHRYDDSQLLSPDELLSLFEQQFDWLLVIDEADQIAGNLLEAIKRLPENMKGRVHAILACRDTDWIASSAHKLDWSNAATFTKESLEDLNAPDAQAIVDCWTAFGAAGLGELSKASSEKRAEILVSNARAGSPSGAGSFFGALLQVRMGDALQEHARSLLDRLRSREIPGGSNLRDALACIAVMHSEGFDFLSRSVLSAFLNCPPTRLYREVLVPLGQEAAITATSTAVFTRHKSVAQSLVSVLRNDYEDDIDQILPSLVKSAICLRNEVDFVPGLHHWRFTVANHFLESGNIELAIKVSRSVLDVEPGNARSRVNLATLLRKAEYFEESAEVLRAFPSAADYRGYYHEWSLCERFCGNSAEAVLLSAFALSDQINASRISNHDAMINLLGLGGGFGELYDRYHDRVFVESRVATACLGLTLHLDETAESVFSHYMNEGLTYGVNEFDLDEAILKLQSGVELAQAVGLRGAVGALMDGLSAFTLNGLRALASGSLLKKKGAE